MCLVLAAAAALILWDTRGGQSPGFSISFFGYTNSSIVTTNFPSKYAINSSNALTALIRATNAGRAPVVIWYLDYTVEPTNDYPQMWNATHGGLPPPRFTSRLLNPGQSMNIDLYLPPKFDWWSANVIVGEDSIWESVLDRIGRLVKFRPGRRLYALTLGPITNQPPAGGTLNR
jgi:hypothetical protein